MLLSKQQTKLIGITLTSITLALCVISIILAGIDYQLAGPNFKPDFPYFSLPGLQIACIIYSFFIVGWGYIAFAKPNYACSLSYLIFITISLLFSFSIGIFSLIAYNVGFVNTFQTCNGQFSGIFSMWQGMDTYLQQVNNALCSDQCPCSISEVSPYVTNKTVLPMYTDLNTTTEPLGAVAFQNCSEEVKYSALEKAKKEDSFIEANGAFDADSFADYMAIIEKQFECTGWCNTTYVNDKGEKVEMFKYLFSDVNRGPAKYSGCLDLVMNWLPGYLGAYGSVTMVLGFVQVAVMIIVLLQVKNREDVIEEPNPKNQEVKVQ
jgi:hypothetical protein